MRPSFTHAARCSKFAEFQGNHEPSIRFRIQFHKKKHRYQGQVALEVVHSTRDALMQGEAGLRGLCYELPSTFTTHEDGPPRKPVGVQYNDTPLELGDQTDVAHHLQHFRDLLAVAVTVVNGYQSKIKSDQKRRQKWF